MSNAPKKLLPRGKRPALTRSQMMGRIRSTNTRPERAVRSAVHALGVRFRNEAKDLPGKPDLVNRKKKWAIFVHGCFWHGHEGCRLASSPRSNTGYWSTKLARNRERDARNAELLRAMGYRVLVVWECETRTGLPLPIAPSFFSPP
jgi:DNA mismatch endonuclease (patch repair protein)